MARSPCAFCRNCSSVSVSHVSETRCCTLGVRCALLLRKNTRQQTGRLVVMPGFLWVTGPCRSEAAVLPARSVCSCHSPKQEEVTEVGQPVLFGERELELTGEVNKGRVLLLIDRKTTWKQMKLQKPAASGGSRRLSEAEPSCLFHKSTAG